MPQELNKNEKKKLSVLLVTYNHERHINTAVTSILRQKIPNSISQVEIIVADDASIDKTIECIKKIETQAKEFKFHYLPKQANLGITRNYERGFAACTGDYVAILEGDDYWISEEKLSKQIAVLNDTPDCVLCSTNYFICDESTGEQNPRVRNTGGSRNISISELIDENIIGNFSTCVYRREALNKLPQALFNLKSYDWIVNICIGMQGKLIFLHEPMSVYRLHPDGIWSSMNALEKLKAQQSVLSDYDALTGRLFHDDFSRLERRLAAEISRPLAKKPKGPLSRAWRKFKNRLKGATQ